nr:retrovirus-related Pol polyprotein from transposon TNT 1-94 [Tanacetum cinerariifolium]
MPNPEDITDLTTTMNMALSLMAKAFKLNYSTPTNNNQMISLNPRNRQIAQPSMNMGQDKQLQMVGRNGENQFRQHVGQNVENLNGYNNVQNNGLIGVLGNANHNLNGNGNLVAARARENGAGHNGNQIRCYNYRGVEIQLKAEKFDLMAVATDLDEIEEVNANSILMANLQEASTSGIDNTKTRRPQPRSNTKNDRVPSASKSSCNKNKGVKVEEHHRNLLVSKNKKHMSTTCNNIKFASQNVKSKVVFAMCKQCLISVNHDVCLLNYVNGKTSRGKKQTANVSINEKQKKQQPKVIKTKKVGFIKRLATPKPSKPRFFLRWSPTGRLFDLKGKIIASSESESQPDYSNGDIACTSNPLEPKIKRFPNSTSFLGRSKDEAPKVIKTFLKRITILLQSHVIIIRTNNGKEFENQVLKEYFDSVGISHQVSSVHTPQQNRVVKRRNQTLVEAARTMFIFSRALLFLWAEAIATACFTQNRSIIYRRFNKTPYELINGRKLDISFLHVFGALCYPKNDREDIRKLGNDREDIRKLGAKGDIGFFIGYSADSCAFRVYNRRTKKIMVTMNVSFDELLAMAFEQRSSKLGLQSMTSRQISSGLDLTYAPSTITTQQPTEGDLDLQFEAMKNLATTSRGKKKTTHLLIPNIRFTKLIIHHLKAKHNIHPRTGSPLHYSHDENVLNTLRFVRKDGREIFSMSIPDALLTDEIKEHPTTENTRSMLLSINNIWMMNMVRQRKEEQQSLSKLPWRALTDIADTFLRVPGHPKVLTYSITVSLEDRRNHRRCREGPEEIYVFQYGHNNWEDRIPLRLLYINSCSAGASFAGMFKSAIVSAQG